MSKRVARSKITPKRRWRLLVAGGAVIAGLTIGGLAFAADEKDGSDVAANLGSFKSIVGLLSGAVSNATDGGDEFADEANATSIPFLGGKPGSLLGNVFEELGPLSGFDSFAPADDAKVRVIDDKVNALDTSIAGDNTFPTRTYQCGATACNLDTNTVQQVTSIDLQFQVGGSASGDIDFDSLGLPSIGFAMPNNDATKLHVELSWGITARLVADANGLRLAPSGDTAFPHELTLGATITLQNTSFLVNLGALKVRATEETAPKFSGTLQVDVADNGDLSFGFKDGALFEARWGLKTEQSPLMGVEGDLDIKWTLGTSGVSSSGLVIKVDNILIHTEEFVGQDLKEAASKLRDVTHPIRTAVSPLLEPLPGLSDISAVLGGDDVTMLRLMETANSADPSLRDRIIKLQLLDDAVGALQGGQPVNLGSFTLVGDEALVPVDQKLAASAVAQLKTIYNECGPCKTTVDTFRKAVNGGAEPVDDQGFQVDLPVLRKPESLAGLLLGRDVDLITFDTGSVGYGPENVNIPVARFLIFSVDIDGKIEARLRVKGGVDTRGIFDLLRDGKPADVVNGVYIQNPPDNVPIVKLSSDVELDLATGIKFVEVELGGGPKVNVQLKVPSNTPGGKLRPALEKGGIGCKLLEGDDAFADFFVNITATFDYLIDDYTEELVKHTLLDENDLCAKEDENIKVAEDDGNGNLTITTASQRKVEPATEPDTVTVYMTHKADGAPDRIFVTVNNNRDEDFPAAGIENIRYDSSDDARPVIFRVLKNDDKPFELNVIIATGNGDDDISIDNDAVVQVTTNGGADNIIVTAPVKQDESGDDETLTLVSAGPGNDYIAGSDEGDILGGGAGNDVIYGGGGIDRLNGGADNDTLLDASPEGNCLIGGPGNDQLIGGPGIDQLFGDDVIFCSGVFDPKDVGVDSDGTDVITTGGGADLVIAGGKDDEVRLTPTGDFAAIADRHAASWKQGVTVHGNGGHDVITTGNGADWIHGGPDDDEIYADRGPIDSGVFLNAGADTIFGGKGADKIWADGDSDFVWGDNGVDKCAPPITGQPAEQDVDGGADTVYGGDGDDQIALEAGADYAEGQAGADTICGHKGIDTIHAGDDDDSAFGGTDGDYVYGDADADTLYGNADSDLVDGGTGDDRLVGGSSAAGTKDAGDAMSGNEGIDLLIGDNGDFVTTARIPSVFDLFAGDATLGGADTINGGDGADRAFGGLAGDTIHGDAADDHLEGNLGDDAIYGDAGEDDLIGGTSSEALPGATAGKTAADVSDVGETLLSGGPGRDVIIGDNGDITRPGGTDPIIGGVARAVTLFDRDRTGAALAAVSGGDYIEGNQDSDRIYGQGGPDYVKGNEADDFVEGNQDGDRLEGNDGEDDLIGGSSFTVTTGVGDPDGADRIAGGAGADVILGDNAAITRATTGTGSGFDWDSVLDRWLGPVARRSITLLDKATLDTTNSGDDVLSGGAGQDVLFGQDGVDRLYGGSHDDYQEGNGGADVLYGDQVAPATGDPHESGQPALDGTPGPDGQDDQLGGSSWIKSTSGGAVTGQRDGNDELHGDGNADVQLGDNGRVRRIIVGGAYVTFQPITGKPTVIRQASTGQTAATALPARFDVGASAATGVWGNDVLYGDAGDDLQLGQDGDDTLYGGAADDDQYGELGNDRMFGEAGQDAMLGDRGVITNRLVSTPGATFSVTAPPQVSFTPFAAHPLDRRVDLNDDGDGSPLQAPGITTGGNDFMRGGPDHDALHGGAGNDLMNGDAGGDYLFGDNGADVMWGGKGRECADPADLVCLSDRGANDSYVDYLFGGAGLKTDPVTGGADILDFRPRPGIDPAAWFEITSTRPTDAIADHQHHQGIDWIYGGLDRDVMQANVADNGPNAGDRLIDWTGAYNLYTHCPAAYGGYNDIRQLSPSMQAFLEQLAYSLGAGKSLADLRTKGTSGYNELALVYSADVKTNSGSAYPTTPGHFEQFSCEP